MSSPIRALRATAASEVGEFARDFTASAIEHKVDQPGSMPRLASPLRVGH